MKPPLLAQAILMAIAGPCEAEFISGDLEEEFAMLRQASGPAAARRWYAWQVARSVSALLQLRVRSGELTQIALLASLAVAAPLLLLDRLWQFVYSQIPLKDGLGRAPEILAFNALIACACAAALGASAKSRPCAAALAFAAGVAVPVALCAGAASVPPAYVVALALAIPASTLLTFARRKSR